jgi:hypothetical protein
MYLAIIFFYSFFIVSSQNQNILSQIRLIFFVWAGIILTHIAYGAYFLKGLLAVQLKEEE